MGVGGGSMALWQKRPGMPKPLTPRSRKRLIREARIKAAAGVLQCVAVCCSVLQCAAGC